MAPTKFVLATIVGINRLHVSAQVTAPGKVGAPVQNPQLRGGSPKSTVASSQTMSGVTKNLTDADSYIHQLNFAITDHEHCNATEQYVIANNVFGMIRGPFTDKDKHLYPYDKAVTWFGNHESMALWINYKSICCDVGDQVKCMCNIANDVQIDEQDGSYDVVAMDSTLANVTPIQPKWLSKEFQNIFSETYSWVFQDKIEKGQMKITLEQLQQCVPSDDTWIKLNWFNTHGPGLPAYKAITKNGAYGLSGQMGALKCVEMDDNGNGGCECRGANSHCTTEDDVDLFCGDDPSACDPRPFFCPEVSSDADLPVGYVRAYLHKFLDAIPYFRGTGFSDEDDSSPEYIVSPNVQADSKGLSSIGPVTDLKKQCNR